MPTIPNPKPGTRGVKAEVNLRWRSAWANDMGIPVSIPKAKSDIMRPNLRYGTRTRREGSPPLARANAPSRARKFINKLKHR